MKKLLLILLFVPLFAEAQIDKLFGKISLNDVSVLLDQNETHCMVFDEYKKLGLVYELATNKLVHTVNLDGLVPKDISRLRPHQFDFKNGKVILVGYEGGINPGHYFILDEARDIFRLHDQFLAQDHGPVQDVIGDWVIFSFNQFAKNKKGEYNFDKITGSVIQYYNWMTREWRSHAFDQGMTNVIAAKNVIALKSGKEGNIVDLMSLKPVQTAKVDLYTLVTSLSDGKVYAATRMKGGSLDKIAAINGETYEVGNFTPADVNTRYEWTPMWNYMVRLDSKNNAAEDLNDIDLIILDKKTNLQTATRISPASKNENLDLIAMQKEIREKRQYANESQLQERFASQIKEQQEWDAYFTPLPKVYKLDYNSIKGNEVTNLALTNRLNLGRGANVYALGLVGECDKAKSYLILKRASSGGISYSTYGILKLDKYGNRMGYREIGRSENNGTGFTQMDVFTISSTGFGNATVETIQRTQDGEYKDTFTHYCGF
ncbi:hypothetical protein [Algoriphagus marinus]|uniref:hypothetical protein n=1 Tax=Algoriphagus marinus TaxID=1925762 RepID=UPI00094B9FA3|nr:hypothetical protein [Algoriphagus marinus]